MATRLRNITSALVLLLLALGGCSVTPPTPSLDKPADENRSLIFGYIDMEDAPSDLFYVDMKRMRPVTDTPYFYFWVVDGLFFRHNTPAGTYKFTQFSGGKRYGNITHKYDFPAQGKGMLDQTIDKPGIYFVGSYKYREVDTGFFEAGKFELEPTTTPTELELLRRILPYAHDPYWVTMIENRIRELEK